MGTPILRHGSLSPPRSRGYNRMGDVNEYGDLKRSYQVPENGIHPPTKQYRGGPRERGVISPK